MKCENCKHRREHCGAWYCTKHDALRRIDRAESVPPLGTCQASQRDYYIRRFGAEQARNIFPRLFENPIQTTAALAVKEAKT